MRAFWKKEAAPYYKAGLLLAAFAAMAVCAVFMPQAALFLTCCTVIILSGILLFNLRDLSGKQRAEQVLREADERKEEFLSILAHELRGPLATLRAGISLLEKTDDKEVVETVRDALNQRIRELSGLINDLLDMSRLSKGRLSLQKEDLDLRIIVQRALETAKRLIEDRRHVLSVQLPPYIVPVLADPARIERALVHLIDNAAKFTAKGGRLSVGLQVHGTRATIFVRDSGAGISSDKLRTLFQPYSGIYGDGRAHTGLGLGLPLAKKLVELHGGQLYVENSGPGGTEIKIVLEAEESGGIATQSAANA